MNNHLLVFGGSGAVGRQVIRSALNTVGFQKVYAPCRSAERLKTALAKVNQKVDDARLVVAEIPDMNQIEGWIAAADINVESCAVASCLGSTLKTAGSPEKFREIDVGLAYKIAEACRKRGFRDYHLISAMGASAKSPLLYSRTKGELEAMLVALKFDRLTVYRPPLLLTAEGRGESRPLESVAQCVARWTDWFNLWSVSTADVGTALAVKARAAGATGVEYLSAAKMRQVADGI